MFNQQQQRKHNNNRRYDKFKDKTRELVWSSAWNTAYKIKGYPDSATRIADECLKEFDKRFRRKNGKQ